LAIKTYSDVTTGAGTNQKIFTVPAGVTWKLHWAHVAYTSSATVGNRIVDVEVKDASGVQVMDAHPGAVQAASLTYHYEYMQGIYRETSFIATGGTGVNGTMQVPIPQDLILLPGYQLIIGDDQAIDATNDTAAVHFQVNERPL